MSLSCPEYQSDEERLLLRKLLSNYERSKAIYLWFLMPIHTVSFTIFVLFLFPVIFLVHHFCEMATFSSNVVGMSIEKLFDMWRNDEILKYYVIRAAVSALSWLSHFCTSKKTLEWVAWKFQNSSFRHIFSIDMPTTLVVNLSGEP